jgi:hypothetical protein
MVACYTGYQTLQPPASEPVDLALVKQHCRIDTGYDDTLVQMYLTSARVEAERYLNRALFTQKLRYTLTFAPPPTATPLVPQSLIVFPLNWPPLTKAPIEIPFAPCQSVDQVQWGPLDNLTVADPATDYDVNLWVEPAYVAVKPQILPSIPQQTLQIDYTAGWSADDDPAAIPTPVQVALMVGTAHYYENRGDVSADMPPAFYRLLDPFRLWTFAG